MVRLNKTENIDNAEAIYCEFSGDSTDTKPTSVEPFEIAQGSKFKENDTGDEYEWDEAQADWNLSKSGGSGVTVIDLDNDLIAPEIDGVTDVYLYGNGTWNKVNVAMYSGFSALSNPPIFVKLENEGGTVCGMVTDTAIGPISGSATDPNLGEAEGLYLTADSTLCQLTSNLDVEIPLIFPASASFAIGHFSEK